MTPNELHESTFRGYELTSLSDSELSNVNIIISSCIELYNSEIETSFKERGEEQFAHLYKIMNLDEYIIQYVPYLNSNGEKCVWVNCFCSAGNFDWKNKLYGVEDGGNCYFDLIVNIASQQCQEIMVNGYA